MEKSIVKKYLNNPDGCPFCGSSNLNGGHFEGAYNQAWREIWCNDCGKKWIEIFTLTDIEEADL